MIFEKGNAVIKFNDIEILKVRFTLDLICRQRPRWLGECTRRLGLDNRGTSRCVTIRSRCTMFP